MFRRRKNATPFHITDLENLYGNLRDGNNMSAMRFAVRILDRGLNGPPEGIDTRKVALEHSFAVAEQTKAKEICDKLEELIGGKQMAMDRTLLKTQPGAEQVKEPPQQPPTGKHAKKSETPPPAATQPPGGFKTVEPPAEFSKAPHATDSPPDPQAPLVPSAPRFTSTEPGARSVNWDVLAQIVALVIQLVRDWQNTQ